VQRDSLELLYTSKTDDELLALAADRASLREEAGPILADELRRRNLSEFSPSRNNKSHATPVSHLVYRGFAHAKWFGLWLWNSFIATFGALMVIGFFTYSSRPFVSRAARLHFIQTFVWAQHYPLPILVGLILGYLCYGRFRGSYRYWIWVLPAAVVVKSLVNWKGSNQASWSKSLMHFFGFLPFPVNRDQLDSTLYLYISLAYLLGGLVHGFVLYRLELGKSTQ
jgi:hypothetical protein